MSGSELYAGRAMPARGAGAAVRTVQGSCIRRTATRATGRATRTGTACGEGKTLHPSVLVGGVGQRRRARPRLVQTQCWCPRDVGCVVCTWLTFFSSVQPAPAVLAAAQSPACPNPAPCLPQPCLRRRLPTADLPAVDKIRWDDLVSRVPRLATLHRKRRACLSARGSELLTARPA